MYSQPSSRSAVPRQPVNEIANTSPPPTPGLYIEPQNSKGTPSPVSRPLTPPPVGDSSLAQMTIAPCHSVAQHSIHLPYLLNRPDSTQFEQSTYKNTGMFNQSRNFTVTGGTFIDSSATYNVSSNQFMEKLLEKTIHGAEFDSSDRDPPPRCQPGTRLAVLDRCLYFISNCDGIKKMRWVVGAAGVGKSAIMQSVAESPELPAGLPASVFFSINGRNDGTKTIITLAYQFAAKSDSYLQVIEREITRDPSLLRSSMAKQFNKLIIEPFIHNSCLNSAGRVLVIIDGLDECKDHRTQLELLRLISDLCLTYPSSPLVWLIASRPEPHINSFFSKPTVIPAYEKEEILIDSDEARADVERLLREKLTEIKEESESLDPRWSEERDFWKVANAAGGLFAYAQTVIGYIGDSRIGSPASQLSDVLYVIDKHPMTDVSRAGHPMALLDALYERILSKVPPKVMVNTRKLLLSLGPRWDTSSTISGIDKTFIVLCNWLGMTADEAYAAVHHLRSILYVPRPDEAHKANLEAFHKSFIDYISDFTRSSFSPNFLDEARQLTAECTFRILNEAPDGIKLYSCETDFKCGILASGPVARDKMSLTWPVEELNNWNNNDTRMRMYKVAILEVLKGMKRKDPIFQSESCIRFLTTVWTSYPPDFPYYELLNVVFDETRRLEFLANGILKQIPHVNFSDSMLCRSSDVKLHFRHPTTMGAFSSDSWNPSCKHERKVMWEAGISYGWTTVFRGDLALQSDCAFCFERLRRQLKNGKVRSADDVVLVLITSTLECCVQVRLVDPEDGMSDWTYTFWCIPPWDVREKYRTTV